MSKNDLKNIVSRLILIDIDNMDLVFKYPFAGYILFYKDLKDLNFNQIKQFNSYYKDVYYKKFGMNLIRSIDQEGGVVFRFDFEYYPAISSQWVIENEENSFKLAYFNGLILRIAGFNLNFSPVLDVNSNLDNPIIGVRSFSNDYDKVLKLSKAFIKGYKNAGIVNCGKHFPGHGSVSLDSHLSLPETNLDFNELNVFLANLDNLDSIMTSHIVYKDIDNFPATLSRKTLDLLYKNYQGIIFSDALNMLALKNFDFKDVLINSLIAGVDILLVLGKDEIKEEAIDIISDYAIKNESFFKIILNKYNKVNNFINSINEFFSDDFYVYYSDLKRWFYNEFSFNIKITGSLEKFKFYFNNNNTVNFIFGNSYLGEIGIIDKVKNFINSKEIYYIDMNNFDINFDINLVKDYLKVIKDSVNLFYIPIYKDNNFIEFVNMMRNKGIKHINLITFANPFFNNLQVDFKLDLFGFSNIHLRMFKKFLL